MYGDILVPTDGSDAAAAALEQALVLADQFDATVHALYVADTSRDSVTVVSGDVVDALEREGDDVVAEAAERGRERGVTVETEVLQGTPADTIVDYADEHGMDAIVMNARGKSGVTEFLLGSVTERVLRASSVPVLTVQGEGESE